MLLALFAREHCVAQATDMPRQPVQRSGTAAQRAATVQDTEQFRRNVFGLAASGSPQLALEQANARSADFSPAELLNLEHLVVAQQVEWARQQASASNDPDRLVPADRALQAAAALQGRVPAGVEFDAVRRDADADMMTALAVRGRMKEATALYETLLQSPQPLRATVHAAAGDAYTYLDRPDRAAQAYELALQATVEPLTDTTDPNAQSRADVQESLAFAYLDHGRYEEARQLIQSMARDTPSHTELSEDLDKVNPEYGRVRKMQAQYLLYTNRTDEGQRALDELRRNAPFDPSLLNARADGSLVVERPYSSQQMYRQAQADHPGDIETLVGVGKTALELHQYDQANAVATTFDGYFPDNNSVKNFQRDYQVYQRPQLIVDAFGERGNLNIADKAWGVDAGLYSGALATNWRVFAHSFTGKGETGDGIRASRVRLGIGGDYRRDGWEAGGEVHQTTGPFAKTGGAGAVSFRPDDHWRFGATVDSNSNTLPWQAYAAGITGRNATASVRYADDNTRYFNAAYGVSRYSDDNTRQQWEGTWYQRVVNQPRHQFSFWLDVAGSANSSDTAVYFNPRRDYTGQLRTMYQWTPWRYAEKSFSQRVYLTAGAYKQDGFGTSGLWEARLEQYWQLGRKASVTYGIGIGSHRYDASRETTKLIYLNLNVPL